MMDLVIMPKRLVLIATYTPVGKVSGRLDFDPMQEGQWAWLEWGFRVLYVLCCGALTFKCHTQDDPEGGSKEIKEESCHHSQQALTEC